MAKNDDGEFELVLGNRQLMSVFLIVVILLGAFFSMGYLVGRSSASSAVATETKPLVVEGAKPGAIPAETSSSSLPATKATPPDEVKPSPVPKEKTAQQDSSKPKETAKSEEPRPRADLNDLARKTEPATSSDEPRSGTFLQVVATARPDAEIVAESLAKKGFHTTIAPGPSEAVFRVLVGPVHDASDLAETRTRLESAGFKPYVRKY